MKKALIITTIIIIFGLAVPPFFTQAASVNIYFGGKILQQFSIGIQGCCTLGPLARIKDDESGKKLLIFTPAALGYCKKGGHIVGLGLSIGWHGYKYIQPILSYCD